MVISKEHRQALDKATSKLHARTSSRNGFKFIVKIVQPDDSTVHRFGCKLDPEEDRFMMCGRGKLLIRHPNGRREYCEVAKLEELSEKDLILLTELLGVGDSVIR